MGYYFFYFLSLSLHRVLLLGLGLLLMGCFTPASASASWPSFFSPEFSFDEVLFPVSAEAAEDGVDPSFSLLSEPISADDDIGLPSPFSSSSSEDLPVALLELVELFGFRKKI